jgi:hypothetical protein
LESEEAEFNNISSFLETLINDSITSSEKWNSIPIRFY